MKNPSPLDIYSLLVAAVLLLGYFTLEKFQFPDRKLPLRRTILMLLATFGIVVLVLLDYFVKSKP